MSLQGIFVDSFAHATHAVADVPMGADYPFQTPIIESCDDESVTLRSTRTGETWTAPIRTHRGREACPMLQRSSYERLFDLAGHQTWLFPFLEQEL